MNRDPRAEELINLRLALATFALQLDAFEARVRGGPLRTHMKPQIRVSPGAAFAMKIVSAMKNRPCVDRVNEDWIATRPSINDRDR
jgi:hypothetical protein